MLSRHAGALCSIIFLTHHAGFRSFAAPIGNYLSVAPPTASPSPVSPPAPDNLDNFYLGSHRCTIFHASGKQVVLVLHGYLNRVQEYYPLGERFSQLGYAVVIPHDCQGIGSLAVAASWGKEVALATKHWANGRPLAVVGHSMGGGAAMAAAKFVPGISAFIAAHPATILSGVGWAKVSGPILYTTGTLDSGTIGGGKMGATAPDRAKQAYENSEPPKALVNAMGDPHWSTINATGMEWKAMSAWFACYLQMKPEFCAWIRDEMCRPSPFLAWCGHQGVGSYMEHVGMQDAVAGTAGEELGNQVAANQAQRRPAQVISGRAPVVGASPSFAEGVPVVTGAAPGATASASAAPNPMVTAYPTVSPQPDQGEGPGVQRRLIAHVVQV